MLYQTSCITRQCTKFILHTWFPNLFPHAYPFTVCQNIILPFKDCLTQPGMLCSEERYAYCSRLKSVSCRSFLSLMRYRLDICTVFLQLDNDWITAAKSAKRSYSKSPNLSVCGIHSSLKLRTSSLGGNSLGWEPLSCYMALSLAVFWEDERVKARAVAHRALMTKTGQMHARQTSKHIVVVTSLLYLLLLMLTRTSCYSNRILPYATVASKIVCMGKQVYTTSRTASG